MVIKTKFEAESIEYLPIQMVVNRSIGENNSVSKFTATIDNYAGEFDNAFTLNDNIEIFADKDTDPTTKIFGGVIEDINYNGSELKERLVLSGRDYGVVLRDILVSPRIFKNQEVSKIVEALLIQNIPNGVITFNNINSTTTTPERITFNNISLFDAITELAQLSGFYFYVDENKDFFFVQKDSISSGKTFDNTNIKKAQFRTSDNAIFNKVTVYGDRQLTGAQQIFEAQTGSQYVLDASPHNVIVTGSGTSNIILQPGGIKDVNDPATEKVQYLVDFNSSKIILTSGATAGDNTGWVGSKGVIIDYQQSTPLISIRLDSTSQTTYGNKDKIIIDRNIKDISEANLRATTFLSENKDPKIQGTINVNGIINVTPGNTAVVNVPFHNINNETYQILNVKYIFNPKTNAGNNVLSIKLNRKIIDFVDTTKEIILRLRKLEGAEVDTNITSLATATGSVIAVTGSYNVISRSIGSAFYFHIPNHDRIESSSSLLGDMRAGSIVIGSP